MHGPGPGGIPASPFPVPDPPPASGPARGLAQGPAVPIPSRARPLRRPPGVRPVPRGGLPTLRPPAQIVTTSLPIARREASAASASPPRSSGQVAWMRGRSRPRA